VVTVGADPDCPQGGSATSTRASHTVETAVDDGERDRVGWMEVNVKSNSVNRPGIYLRWREKEYEGCRDFFPLEWFRHLRGRVVDQHDCWVGRERSLATCTRSAIRSEVVLDYTLHSEKNGPAIVPGKIRIVFRNRDRRSIEAVFWRNPGPGVEWEPADADWELVLSARCPIYRFPGAHVRPKKGFARPKERPAQQALREELLSVYGRCCITRTHIADALDAAHIDDLADRRSDNPQNALLLRGDVHRLFDRHLVAIHPKSLKVHLAPELREDQTYARLEGLPLVGPLAGYEDHRPDPAALSRRWKKFRVL
jgi:hypothetical protein